MADSLATRYQQGVADSVIEINTVVTRIDERLEIFIDKLASLEEKTDRHIETCPAKCAFSEVATRVNILENKNGSVLKAELKELIKEHAVETRRIVEEIKDRIDTLEKEKIDTLDKDKIEPLRKEMAEIKLTNKDISNTAEGSASKWKTAGWLVLNVLAPLIYITLGAILLKWWGLQTPATP